MAKPVRILSIDGGGVRGIIPAILLAEIEARSGHRIADLFDLVVGTSTGGILVLGLSIPGSTGRPAFRAEELVTFYTDDGARVFPGGGPPTLSERILGRGDSLKGSLLNSAQRVGGVFGGNPKYAGNARYFPKGLERTLVEAFGQVKLSGALVEVAITSYDAKSATAVVFSRSDAVASAAADLSMADAARATSAAPTFFPPLEIVWNGASRSFVDGGVWANNPAMVAISESLRMTAQRSLTATSVILVSLGTGQPPPKPQFDPHRPWLATLTDLVALGTGTDDAHRVMERALGPSGGGRYWRFQAISPDVGGAMDDPTPTRVAVLKATAEALIRSQGPSLDAVIAGLI